MNSRRLAAAMTALLVAMMLTTPGTASPTIEAGVMQSPGSANGQPDADNNTLYLFGKAGLTPCWSKFNNTDGESVSYGEDTKGGNGVMDVKVTCRMDPPLAPTVRLAEGEMINMNFAINLDGDWTNGQGGCANDCENLNVSLLKGNKAVAIKEFDNLQVGSNQVNWDLPVTIDLVPWNGSQESFGIELTMKIKPIQGEFIFAGVDALFGLYYSHPDNAPEQNASVTFPILNETAFNELEGIDDSGGGGDTPGFTTMIGVGGLAAAALLRPRSEDEE